MLKFIFAKEKNIFFAEIARFQWIEVEEATHISAEIANVPCRIGFDAISITETTIKRNKENEICLNEQKVIFGWGFGLKTHNAKLFSP